MSGSSMSLLALLLGVILVCYPLPSHADVHAPTPQAPSLPAVGARFIRGGGGGGAVTSGGGAAVVPPPPPPPSLPAVAPTPSAEDKAAKIALILGNRPEELAPVPPADTPTHQFFAASVSQFGTHFNVFQCEDLLNLHHAPLSSTAKAAAAATGPHPPAPSPSGGALNPTQKNEAAFTENLRALASLDPTHDHFTFYYGSNHQTKMQMVNDHMANVYCYHPLVRITSPTECPSAFYLPPTNPHATDDTQRNIVRCTAYPRLGGGNPIAIDTATRRPLAAAALKQNLKFEKRPSSVGFVTLPDKIPHDCGHHLQVSFSISEHATEPRQAVIKQILAKLLRDQFTVQHLTSGEIETPGNERAEAVRVRICYTGMTGHPFSTRPSKVNGFYKLVDHYRKVMNDLLDSGAIKATEHPPFQYRAPSDGMSFTDVTGSPVGSSFAREFCEEAEKYVEGGETYAAFLESFAKCAGAGENRLMLSPSVFPRQCGLPPPTKKHTPAPPPGARQAVVPPHHEDGLTGTKPHAPAPPKEKYEPATRRKDGYSLGAMLVGAHPPAGK